MAGTFISYRREDAAGYAGRLRESLERRLGAARVFRDVDTLRPGQDFVQAIEARLADCRVMLAVIGREWVDARDATGGRRLDEPYDFVRLEIAAALARPDVLVVPVLVEGASMPAAGELPENIRPLARRHAVSVRDETWDSDVSRLVDVIDGAEPPATQARRDSRAPSRARAAAGGVALAVAVVVFVLWSRGGPDGQGPSAPSPAAAAGGATAPAPATAEPPAPSPAPSQAQAPAGPAFAPYTIDVPRVAEAAFGDLIYTVMSGNVASRDETNELRLRVRLSNYSRADANLWDRSFRLAVGTDVLSPTSDLNEVVPARSIRQGIVTFRMPPRTPRAVLRVLDGNAAADIPLDVSSTGRPAVDQQAEVGDSLSQAVFRSVSRDPVQLLEAADVSVVLTRATSRRFANTLRLVLSVRMMNHGRYPMHSGGVTMRAALGDEAVAPWTFPNEVIDPMATLSDNVVFDLPPTATRVVLRTSAGAQGAEHALDLQ